MLLIWWEDPWSHIYQSFVTNYISWHVAEEVDPQKQYLPSYLTINNIWHNFILVISPFAKSDRIAPGIISLSLFSFSILIPLRNFQAH